MVEVAKDPSSVVQSRQQHHSQALQGSQGVDLMASAFGTLIRRIREGRRLSLRDVGQLCGIDHAYIHRLETGEKEAPSDDTLGHLFRVVKPTKREERVLRFLVGRDIGV